jgi:hypothetical protein
MELPTVSMKPPRNKRRVDDACDSSISSTIDSTRAVAATTTRSQRRKRQRTLLDAFNSIRLRQQQDPAMTDYANEDADSSQAHMNEDHVGYNSNSSLEDDDDDDRDIFLSDKEEAERKVMLEIVFGPNSEFVPQRNKDPVDKKLQVLIRKSLEEASNATSAVADDMTIDTPYQRSSIVSPKTRRSLSMPNILEDDCSSMDTS